MKEVFGNELFKKIKPHADKALAGEEVAFDLTYLFKDDIERNIFVQYIPYLIPNGKIIGFFALANEIKSDK